MQGNNPATRLYELMDLGKLQRANTKCKEAWGSVLSIDHRDHAALMTGIGSTMALPGAIVQILKDNFRSQYDRGTHEYFTQRLNAGFANQNLNGEWATFYAHIDGNVLNSLATLGELFDAKNPAKKLSDEDFVELRNKLTELLNLVNTLSISDSLRALLLTKIHSISIAIDNYRLNGVSPINDAIDGMLGRMFFDEEYREIAKSEAGNKFGSLIAAMANITTVSTGIVQLGQAAIVQALAFIPGSK